MYILRIDETEPKNGFARFCREHGLGLVVTKRAEAEFEVEFTLSVAHYGGLCEITGRGRTEQSAIEDIIKKIAGKEVIIEADSRYNRHRANVPSDLTYYQ